MARPDPTPRHPIADALRATRALLAGHGPVGATPGLASTALALGLAILSLLSVLAFHWPQYLTTPMLRARYDVDVLRAVLAAAMVAAGTIALVNGLRGRLRGPSAVTLAIVLAAAALGGAHVPVGDFPDGTPYVGLDFLVLDLLASTALFVALERLCPLDPAQPVFRAQWQTDLAYFALNHVAVGVLFLSVNAIVHHGFGPLADARVQGWVRSLPFAAELLLCLVVADLMQYVVHRAFHEVPWLWRFHRVHHSVERLDWLAGSRLHLLETIVTRVAVLGPLYALGFSKAATDAFVIVVGLQAVLVHANLRVRIGPLRHLWATPQWHHWHHASDERALDRCYAVNFPWIDRLFGTAIPGLGDEMPKAYGLKDDAVPAGMARQLLEPFVPRGRTPGDVPPR